MQPASCILFRRPSKPGQKSSARLDVGNRVFQLGLDHVLQRIDAAVGGLQWASEMMAHGLARRQQQDEQMAWAQQLCTLAAAHVFLM